MHESSILNRNGAFAEDLMRPLDQYIVDHERILSIKNKSGTHRVFATNLMEEFFHPDTLTNPLVNVNGRGAKGNNNENLIALNPVKVDQIRRTVLKFVEVTLKVKENTWKSCVNAMNQRMSKLKDEKRKLLNADQ